MRQIGPAKTAHLWKKRCAELGTRENGASFCIFSKIFQNLSFFTTFFAEKNSKILPKKRCAFFRTTFSDFYEKSPNFTNFTIFIFDFFPRKRRMSDAPNSPSRKRRIFLPEPRAKKAHLLHAKTAHLFTLFANIFKYMRRCAKLAHAKTAHLLAYFEKRVHFI